MGNQGVRQKGELPHIFYYTRVFHGYNQHFYRNVTFCYHIGGNLLKTAGMIIEYNPLHSGHLYLVEEIRRRLGQDTVVIGVMSGDFVQRGDFAIVRRQARAKAAVESGVDLVLELPLPWAVGSAERFADGGVGVLEATGVVDHLAFGSECGDAEVLQRLASVLHSEVFPQMLKEELASGVSFATARQRAVERLTGAEEAAVPGRRHGSEH